jgi:hypothetical protein
MIMTKTAPSLGMIFHGYQCQFTPNVSRSDIHGYQCQFIPNVSRSDISWVSVSIYSKCPCVWYFMDISVNLFQMSLGLIFMGICVNLFQMSLGRIFMGISVNLFQMSLGLIFHGNQCQFIPNVSRSDVSWVSVSVYSKCL